MEYKLIVIPIIAMLFNQIIKLVLEWRKGTLNWLSPLSYGGMPSTHASVVTSLSTVMAYYEGLGSPGFAISFVLAMLTIKDASGIRLHLGEQGKIINRLIKELPDQEEYKFPVMRERFGHKHIEVVVGIIVSFLLSLILIKIFQ